MKKYLVQSYINELHTSSSVFNILSRTTQRRTWSFISRGQFRINHRSHRKQNVMVIDRPQPRRDGLAVLKILRPEGDVSLWGQRNATFGTDIFTRIYEAYKKIHTDQDYTISPTCAWCGEMYLLWTRISERLLNLEDFLLYFVTVSMLGFILERKLSFKNTVFRDWRHLIFTLDEPCLHY
jgi:hypothetical protein